MPQTRETTYTTTQTFDPTRCRHYVNGEVTVLHCHHYSTLYSQLADDATLFDGKSILRTTTENVFFNTLQNYCREHDVTGWENRAALVESYWAWCGMGDLKVTKWSEKGGTAEMHRSHVDEGWIRKWGKRPQPVNFITQGYLAAAWSVIGNKPSGYYQVKETQSIVSGSEKSVFSVNPK